MKNRYANIFACKFICAYTTEFGKHSFFLLFIDDDSRVALKCDNVDGSNYINASYIDVSDPRVDQFGKCFFVIIGPLIDFYKYVWQNSLPYCIC